MLANRRTESEISRTMCEIASITKIAPRPNEVHVLEPRRQPRLQVTEQALGADALEW